MERVKELLQQSNSAMAIQEFDKVTELQKQVLTIVKQQSDQIEQTDKMLSKAYSNLDTCACDKLLKDQRIEELEKALSKIRDEEMFVKGLVYEVAIEALNK